MKTCPECGNEWAPKFKFCPEDGTPLPADCPNPEVPMTSPSSRPKAPVNQRHVDLAPVPPPVARAASRSARRPAADEAPEPSPRSSRSARPINVEKPAPERPQRLVRSDAARSSRSEAPRAEPSRPEASRSDDRSARSAPTLMVDVAPPEMTHETRRQARPTTGGHKRPATGDHERPVTGQRARPAKAAEVKPPPKVVEKEKPAKRKRDFSETAWFANAPDPERADPETGRVKSSTKDYKPEKVADDKRKQFSLRRDDEE
ncbi:MAG: hypothetical protein U1F43_04320 [Myxococcota bacterium]